MNKVILAGIPDMNLLVAVATVAIILDLEPGKNKGLPAPGSQQVHLNCGNSLENAPQTEASCLQTPFKPVRRFRVHQREVGRLKFKTLEVTRPQNKNGTQQVPGTRATGEACRTEARQIRWFGASESPKSNFLRAVRVQQY